MGKRLLKVLGLIDKPTKGNVFFEGKDTEKLWEDELADIRRQKIGFVFQDFYLLNSLSVRENIMLPMVLDKQSSENVWKTEKICKSFRIESFVRKISK